MKFAITIIILIYTGIKICVAVYATPILTIQEKSTKHSSINISITTKSFSQIRSCDLMIIYDPSVAKAKKAIKSHTLGGTFHSNLANPGVIIIGWYGYPSATLPDGTCLFEIEFERVKHGMSIIKFDDSDDYNCQFYDSNLKKLNDDPAENYYKPGFVTFEPDTPTPLLNVESIKHPATCNGTGLITLSCTHLKDGLYTVFYDGGTFEKINFGSGTAQMVAPAGIYENLQIIFNNQTTPKGVNATVHAPETMHAEVRLLVDESVVCKGTEVTFTARSVNEGSKPSYNWYVNNIKVEGRHKYSYTYQPEDNDEIFVELISSEACVSDNPATSEIRTIQVIDQVTVEIKMNHTDTIIHAGTQVTIHTFINDACTTADYIWYLNDEPVFSTHEPTFTFIPRDGDQVYVVYNADNPCLTEDNSRSNIITFHVETVTSDGAIPGLPTVTDLTCYPNPFNQYINLYFSIPEDGTIDIMLIGMNGSKIILVTNERQQAGSYFLDLNCETISAGYYILKLIYHGGSNRTFQQTTTVLKL